MRGSPAVCSHRPGSFSRRGLPIHQPHHRKPVRCAGQRAVPDPQCGQTHRRTRQTYLIDGSAITLDLNIFKKRYRKVDPVNQDYAWSYSTTNGYYLGYKLALVIERPSLIPVAFLLHRGSPGDARLLPAVLADLKRRRILRAEDATVCDT